MLENIQRQILLHIHEGNCGLFCTTSRFADTLENLCTYDNGKRMVTLNICRDWHFFEVLGLTEEEFALIQEFYYSLLKRICATANV